MYGELAHLWHTLSDPAGYSLEARLWRRALEDHLGPPPWSALELGVGGGNNLSHLRADLEAVAVDLSPGMLENSRRINPGVEHRVGDMRTVRVGRTFDAVLIHDAIAYMTSRQDLAATFETARVHLRPGGVLVTTPDDVAETYRDPRVRTKTARRGETEVTFLEYCYDPDPEDEQYETRYVYLLREGRAPPEVVTDVHTHGLFSRQVWLDLLEAASFDVEVRAVPLEDPGREGLMFVAVRRPDGGAPSSS